MQEKVMRVMAVEAEEESRKIKGMIEKGKHQLTENSKRGRKKEKRKKIKGKEREIRSS